MSKKPTTAFMVLVALAAMTMASTASAATITSPTGTSLAAETKIKATNIGVVKYIAGSLEYECSSATMTGTLVKNATAENTEVTIETAAFSGTATEGQCTGGFLGNIRWTTAVTNGTPYCLKFPSGSDEFQLRGNSCTHAARSLTFILDTQFFGECKYERTTTTGPVKGMITTDTTGDAQASVVSGANSEYKGEAANNLSCPATLTLQMTLTLEADTETASLLYFS